MIRIAVAAFVALAMTTATPAQNLTKTVEIIKTEDWLKLPEEWQVTYVAGVVDGMAYVLYNSDSPDHDKWVACVQKAPLQDLIDAVKVLVATDNEFMGLPLSYAVSTSIGKRRPC